MAHRGPRDEGATAKAPTAHRTAHEPSAVSCKSENSVQRFITFQEKHDSQDAPGPSTLSCKSENSVQRFITFKREPGSQVKQQDSQVSSDQQQLESIFKLLEESIFTFVKKELKRFHEVLVSDYPECLESEEDEKQSSREAFLNITLDFLKRMDQEQLAERLWNSCYSGVKHELKSRLQQRFSCVFEGIAKAGNPTLLNQIYTELYITEGEAGVNQEHEVRHIESFSRRSATEETTITCEDIFKGPTHRQGPIRTALTDEPIRTELTDEPIRTELTEEPIRTELTDEPIRTELTDELIRTELTYEPIRTELTYEPIREELTEGKGPIRTEFTEGQGPMRTELTEGQGPMRTELTEGPIRAELTEGPIRTEVSEGPIRAELTEGQGPIRTELTEGPIRAELTEGPIRAELTEGPIRAELTEEKGPIRVVLTKGVAGVGKTVLTQKFSLDWAEGRANQDIHLLFPFTFRELNVLRDTQFSLVGLLQHFFSESKGLCSFQHLQVVFIFDGLDECRLPLDFTQTRVLTEPTESGSVDVLLVNLIRGSLLPSARLWITTRPAAANQIPAECVSMVTEVRGFTDPQKEQYFRKRFRDEEQATAVISHIKTSCTLYIMCHIPVFCWIISTVLHHAMKTKTTDQLPQTLTQMYIHLLVVQAKVKSLKFDGRSETDPHWTPETRKMVESLGKLAFEQLQKGNLIFYESDLRECGLEPTAASVYSGVFTQVFREEPGLYQDKVYCFIHLSVQEFLAALHVHQTFINYGVNQFENQQPTSLLRRIFKGKPELIQLHRSAVDQALQSPNGHLDLFLRFLLGLSLPTNQRLLQGLLTQTEITSQVNKKAVSYVQKKISEELPPEKVLNLFHCLNELNDHSLVEQIQKHITEGHRPYMSPAQWSALAFILLSSDTDLEEFDLKKYSASEEVLLRLMPVLKVSTKAILSYCNLSQRSCGPLSSVLSFQSSNLTHLDLSHNALQDTGVGLLCSGLKSPSCRLKTLSLTVCDLSAKCCGPLSSVLSSSNLKHLDLSNNELQDSGVELLCSGLKSIPCRLETLRLSGCLVSQKGGVFLVSALSSAHSHLRELDLSYNHPGPSARLLTTLLVDPHCPLEILRLENAGARWLSPGLRKYFFDLSLDPNTAHRNLSLSPGNRTIRHVWQDQSFPYHQDRFIYIPQVLCSTGLTGRCYWEVNWEKEWETDWEDDWKGHADIAVSYKGTNQKQDSAFGSDTQSWSLRVSEGGYSVRHKGIESTVSRSSSRSSGQVGVYLDFPAGSLSFYEVSSKRLTHLYTFSTTFTEPVFPGFGLKTGSVSLVCP